MDHRDTKSSNLVLKVFAIGCGTIAVLVLVAFVWLGWSFFSGPVGGVRLSNEMEQYALDYLAEHQLLDSEEDLVAYYDATLTLDGTEAAILTTQRVVYHKAGQTTSIPIQEIEDIQHRYESLGGDVIEIHARSGLPMKIAIAPLNSGESFVNALMRAWERTRSEPQER